MTRPRFDLSEFWTNAGVDSEMDGESRVSATVRAIEGARTPDELMEMLEGGLEPLPEVDGTATGDGRIRWAALFLAALLALAALVYAVGPSWLLETTGLAPATPSGEVNSPAPQK